MVAPPVPTLTTLFTAHAPVEEYRRRRRAAGAPSAAVPLAAIDTFLMGRMAVYAPVPPHILDLAADATDGDSVAFWVGAGLPVIVPRVSWNPAPAPDWRPLLWAWATERTTSTSGSGETAVCPTLVETTLATPDEWRAIVADLPVGTPLIITLAETAETAADTAAHLDLLRLCAPDATVLLLPLGATGAGPVLAQALGACPPEGSRRLTALRELAPFFAASELGLVAPADDPMIPAILERIEGLVAGNFQFLTLVQKVIETAQVESFTDAKRAQVQARDAERAQVQATIQDMHAAIADKTAYAQSLEDRLRYLEETLLPWKNSVITELDSEVRNLSASKAFRAERLARRLMRR